MPIDAELIPDPVLDDRREADRIAARIHRTVNGLTADDAQLIIDYGEALKAMINSAGAVSEPLLPELSSAEPAEAHMMLLTEIEGTFTETLYRFNQLPDKVRIALLRLLGITLQPAVAASCTLQFTKLDDYLNIEVEVPGGVQVRTEDRQVIVETTEDLIIAPGEMTGTVQANALTEGDIRATPNSIGVALTSLAGIATVTNTATLSGGSAAETAEQGKIRAREEIRIGRHLGSIGDFEDYTYFNVLRRKGRVTGFEGFRADFTTAGLGNALIIVQGVDGLAPTAATLAAVQAVIAERHVAGTVVVARPPVYKTFNITAQVVVATGQSAATLIAKATANLRAFFDPLRFEYGPAFPDRFLSLSDCVGQIEAAGPRQISVKTSAGLFEVSFIVGDQAYHQDLPLEVGELPLLDSVTLYV